ncbi:hypothetical protein ACW4TU_41145 [Streptomyces sp. QTS52]
MERAYPVTPRGWESGVRYEPGGTMVVTAPPADKPPVGEADWRKRVEEMGLATPDGFRVRLVEAKHDPAAWHRDNQGDDAVTRAVWRCRYVIEPGAPAWLSACDVGALVRDAMCRRRQQGEIGPVHPPDGGWTGPSFIRHRSTQAPRSEGCRQPRRRPSSDACR